jgi:putative acetyltransferase
MMFGPFPPTRQCEIQCVDDRIRSMPEIRAIRPDQIGEAKHLIYRVAFPIFHAGMPQEEAISYYQTHWPLHDLDDVENTYFSDGGAFLVMLEEERIIGTGAFHRMDAAACEIKRLWFLPEFQGLGLGYQMMMRILDLARKMGYHKARLATSPAFQGRAYAFYHRLGFYDIPRFNDDPEDVGMELDL